MFVILQSTNCNFEHKTSMAKTSLNINVFGLSFATLLNFFKQFKLFKLFCLSGHNKKGANKNNITKEYVWRQNKDYVADATC